MTKETYIKKQAAKLTRGEINRRRFIMSALATGVTLPTATSLAHRAEAAPKAGGVLRYGGGDALLLEQVQAFATGNTLVERNASGAVVGELARSFEPIDELRWAIHLRDDVAFHDGTSLSAQTVIDTIAKQIGQLAPLENITSLHADGAFRVLCDLKRPNPSFSAIFCDHALVMRSHEGAPSGPYRSVDGKLMRVSNYWKPARAFFEAIEIHALPDPIERQSALINHEVDFIDSVDPRVVALLKRTSDIDVFETEATELYGFKRAQNTLPALSSQLTSTLNPDDLLKRVLLGRGRIAETGPTSSKGKTPMRLHAASAAFPGAPEAAHLAVEHGKSAGIPITLVHDVDTSDFSAARQPVSTPVREGDVFPLRANAIHAYHTSLAHGDLCHQHASDGARIAERWWFA